MGYLHNKVATLLTKAAVAVMNEITRPAVGTS
jgi:hypothetical protein